MKKITITLIILLAAAAIIYFIFRPKGEKGAAYQTVEIQQGTIQQLVTATGTIEPITQVEVGTQVSGIIAKIYVDYNSIVKKGDVIAELDRTLLLADLASQTATLESNKNEYDYQKKNYDRVAGLYEKQLVSTTEIETALYQYERAKRAYEKSQADLVRTRTNLSYATILSPIDGVVLSRAVDEGQTVAASFNTPTLFTIANDLRKMQVIAKVDEGDIGQIEIGQQVTFTVYAFSGDVFKGTVSQIRLQPINTSNVITYEVVINAPNPDLKLKPGLTADVKIFTLYKENILMVPLQALTFQERFSFMLNPEQMSKAPLKQGEGVVWRETESGIAPVTITTGVSDRVNTEVRSGLKAGDRVAIGLQTAKAKDSNAGTTNPFMPQRRRR